MSARPQDRVSTAPQSRAAMVAVPGGVFRMGSDVHYPEEAPSHQVRVDGFSMDPHPVTNSQFDKFVAATRHVTLAEKAPDPAAYPDARPDMLYIGSLVFMRPRSAEAERRWDRWWTFLAGANWRHPYGPGSCLEGLDDHPVVHVAYEDALAYARWAEKDLPTEAEWELAARGGLVGKDYAWGDDLAPAGRIMANYWQGEFPWQNLALDGYERTSPVMAFAPNGYGLYDMIGNVWEWTSDWYRPGGTADAVKACCVPHNPRGAREEESRDPDQPAIRIPRKVIKGGSHLCAENYCRRYRPAARYPQPIDTSTSHVGFRCIIRT